MLHSAHPLRRLHEPVQQFISAIVQLNQIALEGLLHLELTLKQADRLLEFGHLEGLGCLLPVVPELRERAVDFCFKLVCLPVGLAVC